MRRRYVRGEPGRRETLAAAFVSGALGVGVGLVAFYLARLLLSRDVVGGSRDGVDALPAPGRSGRRVDGGDEA
jgi:hypothetical protein